MVALGAKLNPFDDQKRRLFRLVWISYVSARVVAGLAALFNRGGLWLVLISASLGSEFGLILLPRIMRDWRHSDEPAKQIERSRTWIVIGIICSLSVIFLLAPGVTLSLR